MVKTRTSYIDQRCMKSNIFVHSVCVTSLSLYSVTGRFGCCDARFTFSCLALSLTPMGVTLLSDFAVLCDGAKSEEMASMAYVLHALFLDRE